MNRLNELEQKIRALYQAKDPDRADWADWLYENHIFIVSDFSESVAKRFSADVELSSAAGMLHDIADAVMSRENPGHEEKSLVMARQLLFETRYSEEEIFTVVDDAILLHSCRCNLVPQTLVGKAMATGDAMAHLETNFYEYAIHEMQNSGKSLHEIAAWALPKIEREYRKKIFFEEVRNELEPNYERTKALFSF